MRYILITLAIFSISLTSCEKVIEIELNEADQRIIVEARLMDTLGGNYVNLSKSGSFYQDNNFDRITGATITISDNQGNSFPLTETASGFYTNASLQGVSGVTYTLTIDAEGEQITATSTMPPAVSIDSLTLQAPFGGFGGPADKVFAICHFNDLPGIENFYKLEAYQNGQKIIANYPYEDPLFDGNSVGVALFNDLYEDGDFAQVVLLGIDEANYDYFVGLQDATSTGSSFDSAPGNPTSNLNGNAIGHFGAYSVASDTITVQL